MCERGRRGEIGRGRMQGGGEVCRRERGGGQFGIVDSHPSPVLTPVDLRRPACLPPSASCATECPLPLCARPFAGQPGGGDARDTGIPAAAAQRCGATSACSLFTLSHAPPTFSVVVCPLRLQPRPHHQHELTGRRGAAGGDLVEGGGGRGGGDTMVARWRRGGGASMTPGREGDGKAGQGE